MMFVILVYDVEAKRDGKVLKTVRKYLNAVQRSVFQGNLTESKLKRLKNELRNIVDVDQDYIRIYEFSSTQFSAVEELGKVVCDDHFII